jgi:hypothetical protein
MTSRKVLREQLRFQRRSQLLSMTFYVTSTVGTPTCTSAAGVLAGMHYDGSAAVLAAVATMLVGAKSPAGPDPSCAPPP